MTNSARRRRKSPSFHKTNSDESCSVDMSDSDVSSQSKSTRNSRRTSSKKLKRAATAEVKQTINWKCDPVKICDIIKQLCPEQLKWIEELGFGSFIDMIECKLPRKLTIWLMKRVDCDSKCLVFRNRKVSIVHAVENLLKLPALDKAVPMPRPGRVRDKPFRGKTKFKSATAGRGESLKEATDMMLTYKEEKDKDKFCSCFMKVILCAYLAPTTGYQINRSYLLGALKDLSDIPRMNWCRFAADYLIDAIRDSRGNKVHNLNVGGCVHILHLIYADLLKSDLVTIPEGYPRIKYVSSVVLEQIDNTGKKKTQDHCKFFESLLDDEKLEIFPTVEDHDDDIDDNAKSTHSMPLVTATISNVPCQEKHKLPQKVVQTSKKRPSDQSIDENLIKRIKKLEDHYTAERQKLITLSKRKLQNNLQQLEIKKTKEMAALVQEEIHKAMLPMNDDARAGSSLHNDDPTLTKGSIGTESPCHSNLDEVVLLSAKSAQCGHQTSTHVDAIPQLTAGTPSSPTFMNEIVQIGTHESPPATNLVNKENVKLDNFHPASSFVGQITQYEPSSSKEIIPTDQIVQAEPAACKDPFMERQETIERQDTFVANVLPASNICAVPHQPDLVPAVIIPTSSFILPNKDGDQVHSHIVEAEKNNIPSEDSSMLKIVGTDVQADTASVVPVSTNITGPGQGYPGDQPESNVFVVEHAKHDSIINVLHEVRNTVTTPTTVDVIPDTDFIAPKSTESASEILVADAHKATNMDSLAHNAASDVIQLQHTDKTTLEDEFQNQSNKQFGNLDVSKNEIESKKDIEIADSHATLKDVADISSPPLSIEIVGDVSIMSVSQMTREYDRMNVPGAATIDTTEHIAASTLHEVSRPEDTDKLIQPQHIVFETSVLPDHRSSSLDVLQIDHSNLLSSMPKPSTQPPGITLQIGQTSPKESSAMQDSDQKLLDKCVEMILGMTTNPPPANDNNQSLSHAINEVLSETLEQTLALAEIETQCTAGDIESSSCQSTQQEVANVAQNDLTGQKEEESQDHPSNNSVAEDTISEI
ncbi:uncharacterized protein LOC125543231 isoform X3 [Triticum urartu]|uniref:uncharacterized protein LOC125543231 isoform X3 n=1 Tax=Triticum urartu TaxID=4572 RepID=UPI0020434726|nr:uncharacterized protein LOC125543231 isoform X3 [Triticum urartu]